MIQKGLLYTLLTVLFANFSFGQDKIEVLPISTGQIEQVYAPKFYKEGIVFCGVGVKNEAITIVSKETDKPLTDIFFTKEIEGNYSQPKLFSNALKSSFHDGPITFSEDGKTAYFTRSLNVDKKLKSITKRENKLGVFKATFNGEEWTDITSCSFNSVLYNVGQPALSPDEKTLYVVSDIAGGFGGKDIYSIKIEGDEYGDLINLGDEINTTANEIFPFMASNQSLYFSSDKKGGYGGLDVYHSAVNFGFWDIPTLMDTLINSSFDDFAIVWSKSNKTAYFSSNRGGKDQLYKANITYPEFTACTALRETQLCFEFFEEATLNVDSVAMVYEWDFGDGITEQTLETFHCFEKAGMYVVALNVMDPMIDKVFVNEATYELEILEVIQPQITCYDSIFVGEEFAVEVQQGTWKDFVIADYYIDYGNSVVLKNRGATCAYDSVGVKEIKILIAGRDTVTNQVVTACFYRTIKVRAKIKVKESSMSLMEKQGFLATKKLNNRETSFYVLELFRTSKSEKDNPTPFKGMEDIVERYDSVTNQYVYLTTKASTPFDLIPVYRKAHLLGFQNAQVKQFSFDSNSVQLESFAKLTLSKGGYTNIVLKGIYFGRNENELNPKSKKELDLLAYYLNVNSTVRIEIEAHTDARKDDVSNLKLSQQRADAVLHYLVNKGVEASSVNAVGYGETQPIATNETEEGRAKNRRVVFKILAQ